MRFLRKASPHCSKNVLKPGPRRNIHMTEEITSSESDTELEQTNTSPVESEDEYETPQEKKLKLAKEYLRNVEEEETRRLHNKIVDENIIASRLKRDYLISIGEFRKKEADNYKAIDHNNICLLKCPEHSKDIIRFCVSSDDKFLFSGSKDGNIVKWDLISNKKLCRNSLTSNTFTPATDLAMSTDNKYLVVSDEKGYCHLVNSENLQVVNAQKTHKRGVVGVTFKRNAHVFYTCSKDGLVKVWSIENDQFCYTETLYGHEDIITTIDSLDEDKIVTSGGLDGTIRLWKVSEESHLIYKAASGSIDTVKFIDRIHFVSGDNEGNLTIWQFSKKKPLCVVKEAHGCDPSNGQPYWIISVVSLVNTDVLASGSNSGTIKVWKLEEKFRSMNMMFEIPVPGFINSMCFTANGNKLFVSASKQHHLGRWSVLKLVKNAIVIIPLIKQSD